MRRISILAIIFLLSFFLSATAGPSVPFNLVFNKQNENVLTFTDKEPGPEAASETVGEISSVSFPSLMSAADYDNYRTEGVLPAEIAAYWDVYGKGVTIYLTFGSGEYMLMNSDLSSDAGTDYQKGYNYNVTISSTRQDSINSGAIGTIKAEDYKLGQRIYLVGSADTPSSSASGRVVGSATLKLGLPLPADDGVFFAGQYNGIITLNLIITE